MPSDRTAQLDEFVTAYGAVLDGLLDATTDLDEDAWLRPTGCPGWTVHDQLAHCVGLERRLLGDGELDPDVVVPDHPHLTGEVGRFIERDVEARRQVPHDALRAEAQETFARRTEMLERLEPEQLEEEHDTWFGRMRTSRFLRLRLFDLTSHERDVRAALERLGGLTGAYVPIVVEHVLRSWARAVPTRIDAKQTLRFDTPAGAFDLDLGTGELSRGESEEAAVEATVRLSAADALALAGGRSDAPTLDALDHDGDQDVLERFLGAAAVTP